MSRMRSNSVRIMTGESPAEGSSSRSNTGFQHQRAGNGQHLTFAPPDRTARLAARLPRQVGEQLEQLLDAPPEVVVTDEGAHL